MAASSIVDVIGRPAGLPLINIVDVGANPLSGAKGPYQILVDNSLASLVGFEPDPAAFDKLMRNLEEKKPEPAAFDPANKYPGDMWHHARVRMITACRANGIDAIDGPFGNFKDPDGYRREATWAATLGAVGKWAIHPSQIEIANDVFAPTPHEIEQ